MFKKCVSIVLLGMSVTVYADSGIGNVNNVANTGIQKAGEALPSKTLDVKYTVYNYQMKPAEFAKFLETRNLSKTVPAGASTNIISLNVVKKEDLNTLNQKLAQDFSNKFSGNGTCIVNSGTCAGGMGIADTTTPQTGKLAIGNKTSIVFKVFSDNKNISAKVISDNNISNKSAPQNIILLKSEATLQDIKNKNYVLVSQITKQDMLYGQIILASFGNTSSQ